MCKASLLEVDSPERATVFHTLVFSQFILSQKALPHLRQGSAIVSTAATEAYTGVRRPSRMPPRTVRSCHSPDPLRSPSLRTAFVSTRSHQDRYGPRSSPPPCCPSSTVTSAAVCRSGAQGNPLRSAQPMCSWPARMPPTSPGRFCTSMAARSSTAEHCATVGGRHHARSVSRRCPKSPGLSLPVQC